MEAVRVFNNELSSLYEVKPPISKAKMTQITKSAIKGIKFYKHIVQSVEKFIQKCRPEYKVPGLYVVDSIVRQSRHQFGADKDVFGPRFVKNINLTFQNLFKCNPDDRPKIIRVLNLWQKNSVFPIDVIQPLLDMGHPNSSTEWTNESQVEIKESPRKSYPSNDETQTSRHKSSDSQTWKGWPQANEEPASETRTYAEMSTKNLEKFMKAEMASAMEEDRFRKQEKAEETIKFNQKLLEYDYGDEDEEDDVKNDDTLQNAPNALALSIAQNLLSVPDNMRKIKHISSQNDDTLDPVNDSMIACKSDVNENFSTDVPSSPQQPPLPTYEAPHMPLPPSDSDKDDRVLPPPPLQDLDERSLAAIMAQPHPLPPTTTGAYPIPGLPAEGDKDDRIIPDVSVPPRDLDERSLNALLAPLMRGIIPPLPFPETANMIPYQNNAAYLPQQPPLPVMEPMQMETVYPPPLQPDQHHILNAKGDEDERVMYSMPGEPPLPPQDFDERSIMIPVEERVKKERSRSRSGSKTRGRSGRHRSRSKSPRRKRSRSRSRSRRSSRSEGRERIHEKERERERERERRKKGLPPIKKNCISVCSTTLWLGHVPKSCTEGDISGVFGEFGSISSIDMIPPRGCAFVVMDKRQDANKAIQKLKNLKLQSSSVKMAWAPGKGVKGKEYKEFWDVDAGVSYVPYEKIPENIETLELLEEGGFIDEESLSESLKELRNQAAARSTQIIQNKMPMEAVTTTAYNAMPGPPMVPPPIMPPSSVNLPGMVLPHLMQPQFGLPLPGLLPPQAMVMQMPMNIPPPNPMLMVQQQSQNLLNPQSLQMGMPPMMPRPVPPPVPSTLHSIKSNESVVNSPSVPTAGDATPTEEDGTSVSTPSNVLGTNSIPSSTITLSTTQQSIPNSPFTAMMSLQNANRPMLSVPPPVSSAGTSIPFPPPNVNFSFPPPGVRPPGQHQTSQFPWMQQQKPPFPETDATKANNSRGMPASGMQPHMFSNRLPFSEKHSPSKPLKQDTHESSNVDRKSVEMDIVDNRASSPGHHDMVISTDEESSLDRDYPRIDVSTDSRFQGPCEFPRMPMHHLRGPVPMQQGMRFPMGGPPMGPGPHFPMRMGGPRGMRMHHNPRMDMDFHMHSGPRMPGGPHRENMPLEERRDWYPRDYEGPSFERENRYERQRDSWPSSDTRDSEPRRHSHDHEDQDSVNDKQNSRSYSNDDRSSNDQRNKSKPSSDDPKPKNKPKADKKPNKSLMDDMLKLRFYQRDKNPSYASQLSKKLESKKKATKKTEQNKNTSDKPKNDSNSTTVHASNETNSKDEGVSQNSKKDKDRDARKRSRWGRTLSEERELQDQKRFEVELKFKSYEKSSRALEESLSNNNEIVCDNSSTDAPKESVLTDVSVNCTSMEVDPPNVTDTTSNSNLDKLDEKALETIEHSDSETISYEVTSKETSNNDVSPVDPSSNDKPTDELSVDIPSTNELSVATADS